MTTKEHADLNIRDVAAGRHVRLVSDKHCTRRVSLPDGYAEGVLQAPEQPRDGDEGGSDSGAVISVDF